MNNDVLFLGSHVNMCCFYLYLKGIKLMDETNRRLLEIAGHIDVITEQMKADSESVVKAVLLGLYAVEIKTLVVEMKTLLDSQQK